MRARRCPRAFWGAVSLLEGRPEEATAQLAEAVERDPRDATARSWRGEALRRRGDFEAAVSELDAAIWNTAGVHLPAYCNRTLAVVAARRNPEDANLPGESVGELCEIAPELKSEFESGRSEALERLLERMAGNRSPHPTLLDEGGLRRVRVRPNARTASRAVQERIRTIELAEVLPGFEEVFRDYGDQPTIHCHRGELLLWAGRNGESEADFRRALEIDRGTRWAWIGLGATQLMAGDAASCLATFAESQEWVSPPGRTQHVYRAEAHLRRGEREAAERALAVALELNPERISAHLLAGELAAARGDESERRVRLAGVERVAPGLYADAVELAGSASAAAVTEACFRMMRGNRASGFVSYYLPDGRQRFCLIDAPGM